MAAAGSPCAQRGVRGSAVGSEEGALKLQAVLSEVMCLEGLCLGGEMPMEVLGKRKA